MSNRQEIQITLFAFGFPLLCAVLIILFCISLANAQTGGGNPPSEIRRGANRVQVDSLGNAYFVLTAGKAVRITSTCTGATVSTATEAKVCYDTASGTLKISANGGAYTSLSTGGGSGPTINATNNVIPKRSSATAFTDSLLTDTGTNITYTGTAIISQHFSGRGTAPTCVPSTNPDFVGDNPTCTVSGNDSFGQITLTTGSFTGGDQGGTFATLTFNAAYTSAPYCILVAGGTTISAPYALNTTTTIMEIGMNPLNSNIAYKINYHCGQ